MTQTDVPGDTIAILLTNWYGDSKDGLTQGRKVFRQADTPIEQGTNTRTSAFRNN
jgi:hypothetical protein